MLYEFQHIPLILLMNQQYSNQNPLAESETKETEGYTSTYCEQIAFLLISMLSWTAWPYCFDIPQGVQTQFKLPPYQLSVNEFNNFYVISSLPNAVLNFVSAWITLKIGARKAILLYSSLLFSGQLLIFVSVWKVFNGWYGLMLAGRLLLGFSGYALTSANLALIPKYTNKALVPLFVGIGSMVPWTSEALCDLLTPIFYESTSNVYAPFFAGWIISISSVLFAVILFAFTSYLNRKKGGEVKEAASSFKLKDIRKLGVVMLVIFVTLFFAVSIEGTIIVNANDMLHERVGFSNTEAGTIAMMTLLINGPVTPVWAFIKEKMKHKRRLFPIIGLVLLLDLLVLYFLPDHVSPLSYFMAYLGFILLGTWDSGAVTVIIGSFPTILDERILPLGFSIYTSGLALGMGLSPIITAAIISSSSSDAQGYKNTYYLYFGEFILTFLGLLYLWLSQNPQAKRMEQSEEDTLKLSTITTNEVSE